MKEAIENLLPFERDWFLALNGSDSIFLDNVFWTITGRYIWIPMILLLLFMFFYKSRWQEGALLTVFFVLVFVACDQVASSIFKETFQRLRPTHHSDFKDIVDIVRGYRSGGYSFISGHATNSFGIAVFLSLVFKSRWLTIPVYIWAMLNAYSRVYLGLHFISDILAGAIIGTLLGWLIYRIYSWVRVKFFHIRKTQNKPSPLLRSKAKATGIFMSGYLLIVIIFSFFLSTLPH